MIERHMRRALELGRQHPTHPNPRVGAVIVDPSGGVIGEGAHRGAGSDHAEVVALAAAGSTAAGATLYVTLEPCTHRGRTPPCVDAIIGAGIGTVIVGARDPDPRVSGRGLAALKEAGVEVRDGVMAEEVRSMDPAYFHHRETGLPLVTLKYAMTLDGAIAAADGSSRWITSDEARRDAHRVRADNDAVVVGAGTLRADDPMLSVRLDGFDGPQPVPVVVAGRGDLPGEARIWEREPLVISTEERAVPSGRLILVKGSHGLADPVAAARALGDLGYIAILVEGGSRLIGAWWAAGVITRGVVYLGSKIAGGAGLGPMDGVFGNIADATEVSISEVRNLGPDYRIDFWRQ